MLLREPDPFFFRELKASGVRANEVGPSFLGFYRLMNAFRDHADRGAEHSYAISHFSGGVVMNSHCLIDALVRSSGDAYHPQGIDCFSDEANHITTTYMRAQDRVSLLIHHHIPNLLKFFHVSFGYLFTTVGSSGQLSNY